jgi:hypothetical protein
MKGERNEEKSSPDFQNSMCNGPVVGGSMCKECVCKRERERERGKPEAQICESSSFIVDVPTAQPTSLSSHHMSCLL